MNTLQELKSGKLKGVNNLKLSCKLHTFPEEIFTLSDTLEVLDLTDNILSHLPDNFYKLKKLKILFLSNNLFKEVPPVLAKCPILTIIGIRNNLIEVFDEKVLPLTTRWLILTDNKLTKLPNSIGDLKNLQKCMLSGNQLNTLPQSFSKCINLELLRIAANKLTVLPLCILELPKLSWLAYGGNPFCTKHPSSTIPMIEIPWKKLEILEILGEGTSGLISKAKWHTKEVAVKVFKGDMTSDGLPQEEMDINISIGSHEHLVDVLAKVTEHPESKDVLMLELIPSTYFNLGLPPTLDTCTRDIYPNNFTLPFPHCIKILYGMASAAEHIHERGIMHGDFYAHNIMIDHEANSILGDFGGASYYEPKEIQIRNALERLEIRAFGCLIEEMLSLSEDDLSHNAIKIKLRKVKDNCFNRINAYRPLFHNICKELEYMYKHIYTKSTPIIK